MTQTAEKEVTPERLPLRIDASGLLGRSTNDQFLAGLVLSITDILRRRGFELGFKRLASDISVFVAKAQGTEFTEMLVQFPFEPMLLCVAAWDKRAPLVSDYDTIYATISNQFTWMQERGLLGNFSPRSVDALANWGLLQAECVLGDKESPLDIASIVVDAAVSEENASILVSQARRSLREMNYKLCPCSHEGKFAEDIMRATWFMDDNRDKALVDLAGEFAAPFLAVVDASRTATRWSFIGSTNYQLHIDTSDGCVLHVGFGFSLEAPSSLRNKIAARVQELVTLTVSDLGEMLALRFTSVPSKDVLREIIRELCPTISEKAVSLI